MAPYTSLAPSEQSLDGTKLDIAIVHARWNTQITSALVSGCRDALLRCHVPLDKIIIESVPGSYELPAAASKLACSTKWIDQPDDSRGWCRNFDAIVAIGVLVKGRTMHFEYISDAVSHGLMRVQLDSGTPIIFGVLTLLSEEQGLMRCGERGDEIGRRHNHGEDWGQAAVEMALKHHRWRQHVFLPAQVPEVDEESGDEKTLVDV